MPVTFHCCKLYYLASTTEKLSREIKKLTPVLWNVDRIVHESVRNGGGGKKHRFYYSNIKFSTVGGKPATVDGESTGEEQENLRIPFS